MTTSDAFSTEVPGQQSPGQNLASCDCEQIACFLDKIAQITCMAGRWCTRWMEGDAMTQAHDAAWPHHRRTVAATPLTRARVRYA